MCLDRTLAQRKSTSENEVTDRTVSGSHRSVFIVDGRHIGHRCYRVSWKDIACWSVLSDLREEVSLWLPGGTLDHRSSDDVGADSVGNVNWLCSAVGRVPLPPRAGRAWVFVALRPLRQLRLLRSLRAAVWSWLSVNIKRCQSGLVVIVTARQ